MRAISRQSIGVSLWIDERSALYQSKIDNATDHLWGLVIAEFHDIVQPAIIVGKSHISLDWPSNGVEFQ